MIDFSGKYDIIITTKENFPKGNDVNDLAKGWLPV
jgi:hypothetical protein